MSEYQYYEFQAIGQLSREECDDYLGRLLQTEPQLRIALRARLERLVGMPQSIPTGQRTVEQLLAEAGRASEEEKRERERMPARGRAMSCKGNGPSWVAGNLSRQRDRISPFTCCLGQAGWKGRSPTS